MIESDDIGRVFEGDDPKDLAKALNETLELAGDPGTRDNCRARAGDFSTDRATDEHLRLYASLTASRGS